MNKQHSLPRPSGPLVVALVVAAFGVIGILLVDHGPWNKPQVQAAEVHYPSTKAAANAVGATVTSTAPRTTIEPDAPGPKPVQPPNPGSK